MIHTEDYSEFNEIVRSLVKECVPSGKRLFFLYSQVSHMQHVQLNRIQAMKIVAKDLKDGI